MNVVLQIGERPLKPPQGTDPKDERWETLCQLLDWNRYLFHIEHTDGKRSNHLSHYLVALYKLGGKIILSWNLLLSFTQIFSFHSFR